VPIYEALLAQDGVELPHPGRPLPHVLDQVTVGQAMTPGPSTVSAADAAAAVLEELPAADFSTFPAVDRDGRLVGLVSESKLRRTVAEGHGDALVADLAGRRERLTPEQPLSAAIVALERNGTRQLAVVAHDRPDEVVGIIALSDILRAQARALQDGHGQLAPTMTEVDPDLGTAPP
jgi:CBS domain-containing protein